MPGSELGAAELRGRVALVTGANHGIGSATARRLAKLGADVAVTYLRLYEEPDEHRPTRYAEMRRRDAADVVAAIEKAGSRAVAVEADLSDPAVPGAIFDQVEAALGGVSILINNASGWQKDSFGSQELDHVGRPNHPITATSIDAQFLVDARGTALMIAELARRHRQRGDNWGRIVSLTSGGPGGFPGEVSYGAAKAALENYTMSASRELASLGITANVVYPPVTDTGWVTDDVRRAVRESDEHHHIASPEEVAEVIAWLCTDWAKLVTGSLIHLR